jgi:hypothetical protein
MEFISSRNTTMLGYDICCVNINILPFFFLLFFLNYSYMLVLFFVK